MNVAFCYMGGFIMCIICKRGFIADELKSWLDFHARDCEKDGVSITDDSHIMSPPKWPTRGQLKKWIETLESI